MTNSKILKIMENTKFNEKTKYIKFAHSFLDSFKVDCDDIWVYKEITQFDSQRNLKDMLYWDQYCPL